MLLIQNMPKVAFLLFVALCALNCSAAYKFLGIFHTSSRSHSIVGTALMKGLAQQGHEVTVITPFAEKKPIKNYQHIPLKSMVDIMRKNINNLFDIMNNNVLKNNIMLYNRGLLMADTTLSDPAVQALMRSNQTFDAIICEVFLSDALYGLAEHFQAPLIGMGTFGAHSWNTDMVGSPSPPSYVPNTMLQYTDHMTLLDRVGNLAFNTFERLQIEYFYLPRMEAIYAKHFPHAKRSLRQVRTSAALVLLNQHVSLSFPRPYMPNQIEVGGMHINRKPTPLPVDIQKFLDEAKYGAIYFSMGSNLKSKDLPAETREQILSVFRGIKQRVLWKFEDTNLPGKPDNVYISDWFPQDDILAHANVRAFITHGGLLGTTESIYHGKPVIGIPIFGDQFMNMARAEKNGYGIKLDFKQLSAVSLKSAITRIIEDPSYTQKVRDMSARYRDQPQEPLQLAIFWVEHVVRHKGAQYMHCAGLELSTLQYHNIDAMLLLFGGALLLLALIVFLVRYALRSLLRMLTGKKQQKVKKNQ